ncbi:MAG TPA: hypothetical protein DCY20_11265 [Firmicutes bacterium]|nr:hypothetical protein [Bacillota bacterium]
MSCYINESTRPLFEEMVDKICFYYELDYVLLIEDEAAGFYLNTDVHQLFFDEVKHDDIVNLASNR